jgi:Rieske Fe-S protein
MREMERRRFLKNGAKAVVVTSTCLCGLNGCATFTKIGDTPSINTGSFQFKNNILEIDLSKESNLNQVGGAVKITHSDIPKGVIIARTEESGFAVASLHCTHRGVEVEYNHKQKKFRCASLGGSKYGLDGKNLGGPAGKPLEKYNAELDGEILRIRI